MLGVSCSLSGWRNPIMPSAVFVYTHCTEWSAYEYFTPSMHAAGTSVICHASIFLPHLVRLQSGLVRGTLLLLLLLLVVVLVSRFSACWTKDDR